MKTSEFGKTLIKRREDLRLTPYLDTNQIPTNGWGHRIVPDDLSGDWTGAHADDVFDRDLIVFENAVTAALTSEPTQPQFDAMVCLAYNIGPHAFQTSSVVHFFNAGDPIKAAGAFLLWNDHGHAIERRTMERSIFLYGTIQL